MKSLKMFLPALLATHLLATGCSKPSDQKTVSQLEPDVQSDHVPAATTELAPEQIWSDSPPSITTAARDSEAFAQPQIASVPPTLATRRTTNELQFEAPTSEPMAAPQSAPFDSLPAGSSFQPQDGYATVQVFYATDRKRGDISLTDYHLAGQSNWPILLGIAALICIVIAVYFWFQGSWFATGGFGLLALVGIVGAASFVISGQTTLEKHGVTYTADRGESVRGVCEVTVPSSHQSGEVERPSLLRFELSEDREKHIVINSVVEVDQDDFRSKLNTTIDGSPDQDLLVFIHGYNVDFESAVMRTAQLAVDLPFEGVPVCYSWPSQGKLLSYTVDENNSQWTAPHLKDFLIDLATKSNAKSINVVAHSMGNRAMTSAIQQITWQLPPNSDKPFDQIVLAAPDVDADQFRRDLGPPLAAVAQQVTLYASSADQALIASKRVHGYPRAGESGTNLVFVPGIDTIDVSGIDMSLLGHSYYGDNQSMLRDLYEVVRGRLQAENRGLLIPKQLGTVKYWQLAQQNGNTNVR